MTKKKEEELLLQVNSSPNSSLDIVGWLNALKEMTPNAFWVTKSTPAGASDSFL